MKYLLTTLLILPLLTSCDVIEERYYEPRYEVVPPQVAIERPYLNHREPIHHHPHIEKNTRRENTHGHAKTDANVHGHDNQDQVTVQEDSQNIHRHSPEVTVTKQR